METAGNVYLRSGSFVRREVVREFVKDIFGGPMKNIFISICLFIFAVSLFATDVSGDQSGTWDLTGSPYNIIGEIFVPAGLTLEIEAGVEVIAMGNYKITALGNIMAEGTIADSIRFHGENGLYWGGLRLEDEAVESIFDYCRISNTNDSNDYGIHSINSPVRIDHSYLDDHQKGIQFSALSAANPSYMEIKNSKVAFVQKSGITIVDNSNVLIDSCEVTQCGLGASFYGAIQLSLQSNTHSCSPIITNNYIHHNDKQGLTLANLFGYENMAPTVEYNDVSYNYTGIYLYAGKGTYTWNHIHHNFVENNADSGAGVMLYGNQATAVFTYNEIDHNYTGLYLTNGATVNLGDLNNTDPSDDGYNCIYDNIFYTGEEFSVYNASASNVTAENTVWDDDPPIDVTIIDGNDNAAYGIVDYVPTLSPFAPPAGVSVLVNNGFINLTIALGTEYPTYANMEGYNIYRDGELIAPMLTSPFFIDPIPAVPGLSVNYGATIVYEGGFESTITDTTIFIPHILNPLQNPFVSLLGLFSWDPPEPGSTSNFLYCNVYIDGTLLGNQIYSPWQFSGLIPGESYFAEVSAVYEAGESDPVGVQFYYLGTEYESPQNVTYELFPDYIHLEWDAPNAYVDLYQIYLDGDLLTETSELSFDIFNVTSGVNYEIWVVAVYIDGGVSEPVFLNILFVGGDDILNLKTELLGNHPNPFNPSTTISFTLNPADFQNTKLEIYNLKGQKIKIISPSLCHPEIVDGRGGHFNVTWDSTDQADKPVSSGVYFYKLTSGENVFSRKMLLLK